MGSSVAADSVELETVEEVKAVEGAGGSCGVGTGIVAAAISGI